MGDSEQSISLSKFLTIIGLIISLATHVVMYVTQIRTNEVKIENLTTSLAEEKAQRQSDREKADDRFHALETSRRTDDAISQIRVDIAAIKVALDTLSGKKKH